MTKAKSQPAALAAPAYVYLLRCADDSLYCGYSVDPWAREITHNKGKGSRYTRARLPVVIAYVEECASKAEALSREAQIKKLSKAKKLALITNQGIGL